MYKEKYHGAWPRPRNHPRHFFTGWLQWRTESERRFLKSIVDVAADLTLGLAIALLDLTFELLHAGY